MRFDFLLPDVRVEIVDQLPKPSAVTYQDDFVRLNATEFFMSVPEVADFYAADGSRVLIHPHSPSDQKRILLYLNGSVLGAILHQRGILSIHGSSFRYKGKTVLACGMSGAGKSTITAAFCQRGGEFLTDDVSPIQIEGSIAHVIPTSDRVKLWEDSFEKLDITPEGQEEVQSKSGKYYLEMNTAVSTPVKIDKVLILAYNNDQKLIIEEVQGAQQFQYMLDQIYRKEYLAGMPHLQQPYFDQLVQLCASSQLYFVSRPEKLAYSEFIREIESIIVE